MTESLKNIVREYVDSKEFEYKHRSWTDKVCKEMVGSYWKPIATISASFLAIIGVLVSFIFGHFNTTVLSLQKTTLDLQLSIIKLEQTVDVMYEKKPIKDKNNK